jgi:hypothetical protein
LQKEAAKGGGVLAGGLSYMGNTCPPLQVALQNRFGEIFRILLWSNTLAATLSSSFYERHPVAIAFAATASRSESVSVRPSISRQALLGAVQCEDFRGDRRRGTVISCSFDDFDRNFQATFHSAIVDG